MRTCLDCPSSITHQSRTGRCKACANRHNLLKDPSLKERRLAAFRVKLQEPEYRAKMQEVRRRNGSSHLHWCPAKYRADYHFLRLTKRYSAAEAKAAILDLMASHTRGLDPLAAAIKLRLAA
jgi:hypothetical protein